MGDPVKILTEIPPVAKQGELFVVDVETFGQEKGKLHRPTGIFACLSIALERDPSTVYQIYDHHDLKKVIDVSKRGVLGGHNMLYDLRQMRRYVAVKPRYIHDTMLADQSMQGGYYQTFSLSDLSRRWLGKGMEKDVREDFYTAREMTPKMKQYAALDAARTLEIAMLQIEKYQDDPGWRAYTDADEPMIWPVLDLQGFRVDAGNWESMIREFEKKAHDLEDELDLNVYAYAKVRERLAKQEKLHLPDTTNDTLVEYASNPYVAKIIEARMYRKAVSSYGMKWLEENVESDGKVYADYHITGSDQKGVSTGRMSCSHPNMQNIPQRKLPIYRTRFLASPGHVMEIWDVVQQEPSITAYHSQDRRLLEALRKGESLHLAVAREIYDNPKLTKEGDKLKYSHGKAINLGLTYGLTSYGLAKRTRLTVPEAEAMIRKYFSKYSGVYSYIQAQRQIAWRQGYVTTALGRRSYINPYDNKWMNNAINAPIQGGAVDFTKIWTRKIWECSTRTGIPYTVVGLIHDETVKDTPREIINESKRINQGAFEETAALLYKNIPFRVEAEYGKSWAAKSVRDEMIDLEGESEE